MIQELTCRDLTSVTSIPVVYFSATPLKLTLHSHHHHLRFSFVQFVTHLWIVSSSVNLRTVTHH